MTARDRTSSRLNEEALRAILMLARQLAAQMAEDSFRAITAIPGWTIAHVDGATELAIARMEIATRDALAARGGQTMDSGS